MSTAAKKIAEIICGGCTNRNRIKTTFGEKTSTGIADLIDTEMQQALIKCHNGHESRRFEWDCPRCMEDKAAELEGQINQLVAKVTALEIGLQPEPTKMMKLTVQIGALKERIIQLEGLLESETHFKETHCKISKDFQAKCKLRKSQLRTANMRINKLEGLLESACLNDPFMPAARELLRVTTEWFVWERRWADSIVDAEIADPPIKELEAAMRGAKDAGI